MELNLNDRIQILFPGSIPNVDYILADLGDGPFIQDWFLPDPKPTPEQLAAVKPPLAPLSRRQFFQELAIIGQISDAEALAAVQHGAIPDKIEQFIATHVPDQQAQFGARMLLAGASEFQRDHPLVNQIAQVLELSDKQVDDIWKEGALL